MKLIGLILLIVCFSQSVRSECGNDSSPEVTIRILAKDSVPNSVLWVSCSHNSTEFDLSHLQNCSFPSVTIARFNYCILRDAALKNTLTVLGINTTRVTQLVLSAPKVTHLESNLLQGLSNLTSFIVYNSNISSVSKNAFVGVPNLERLILHDSLFATLPSSVFRNLTQLKVLILSRHLQSLPEDLFSRNINLKELHLYSNELRNLPANIFNELTSMKTLSLSNNQLMLSNNTVFTGCDSLEHLNLRKNEIQALPESLLSNCTKLETIDFSHNQIVSIPEELFQVNINLKKISFNRNSLKKLPEQLISHLLKLENISLSENEIKSLPKTFLHNNAAILRFELRGNYIEELPSEFFSKSHKIKVINLGKNNLTALPDNAFANCLSLEKLILDENNLKSLMLNQFPSIASNVKEINLSRNKLKLSGLYQFGSFVFANQIYLHSIDLSENIIEAMPYALYTLIRLKHLNLERNNITFFSFEFIQYEIISKDINVNLRNNSIKSIVARVPKSINVQAKILISGNPLVCDCKIFDFVDFIRSNTSLVKNVEFSDVSNLKCVEPSDMYDQPVNTVDVHKLICQIQATNDSMCSSTCDCTIQPSLQRILVDCSNKYLSEVPPLSMSIARQRYQLSVDLSSNSLLSFNFSHPSFAKMTNLSLANNSINGDVIKELLPQLPTHLGFFNLSGNNASSLEESFITFVENESMIVDLSGSNWRCDCTLKPLHSFLQTKYYMVYNVRDVFCAGYDKPLIDLTTGDICLGTPKLVAIIIPPLIAIIIAVLGTVIFFKYQTSLRVWLYSKRATRWLVTEKDLDANKEYDAFISYSHEDEDFINETLVPGLENGDPKYKVCLHYRDWRPGELIQVQILESVANSRRTIVILSKNFIKSVWGKMEFRVAHQKALKDNTNRVIVIVYGEMPPVKTLDEELKHYVSTRTYLSYDNARFWDNLRYAMPHKADGTKRNNIALENVNNRASRTVI